MAEVSRRKVGTIARILLVLTSMALIGYGVWRAGWHIWLPRWTDHEEVGMGNRYIFAGCALSLAAAVWSGARDNRLGSPSASGCRSLSWAGRRWIPRTTRSGTSPPWCRSRLPWPELPRSSGCGATGKANEQSRAGWSSRAAARAPASGRWPFHSTDNGYSVNLTWARISSHRLL